MSNNGYFLLTSIGVRPQEGKYKLGDDISTGRFSSTALVKLLPVKPDRVFVLLTNEASEKSYEAFEEEMNLEIEKIYIPDGINDIEINKIIQQILNTIPENSNLILDISQGYRHFPFLFFTSVLYLQSFKNVRIKAIYYGMYEKNKQQGFSPFIELGSILEMIEWYHSVKEFSEMKVSSNLAKMINNILNDSSMERSTKDHIEKIVAQIKRFNDFYGTGLPLGVGDASKSLVNQYKKRIKKENYDIKDIIPLIDELLEYATRSLENFKLGDLVNTKGNWKEKLELDIEELKRQSIIIDSYLNTGHYVNAIRLIREWIISRCTLSSGIRTGWLKKNNRAPIERMLGSIRWQLQKGILIEEKKELATIWDSISKYRNEIAHNGMSEETIDISKSLDRVEEIWERIKEKMYDDTFWDLYIGGGKGKLLITPLGFSKGLLYSALRLINPDNCMIITSKEAAGSIPEILKKADYHGKFEVIELVDPHSGFDEIRKVIDSLIPDNAMLFLEADEIFVNLTGGTTTIQVLVEEISRKTVEMGKNPNKVVIIDRRDTKKQREDPYMTGEIINLKEILSNIGKK